MIKVSLGQSKVPALKLERIIISKRATGRDKDRLAMKVLSDALKAVQFRIKHRHE